MCVTFRFNHGDGDGNGATPFRDERTDGRMGFGHRARRRRRRRRADSVCVVVVVVALVFLIAMGQPRGVRANDDDAVIRRAKRRLVLRTDDADGYDVEDAAVEMAFTHDVETERRRARNGEGDSDGMGNPGMQYARVFRRDAPGDWSGAHRMSSNDALVVCGEMPPENTTRYFSFVTYVYRRGNRVVSAMAGWPVNSANAEFEKDATTRMICFASTRSEKTLKAIRRAFGAFPVNAQPIFDDVRLGRGLSADLLSSSMRVAYWPPLYTAEDASPSSDGDDDVLGEWMKTPWKDCFFVRARGDGSSSNGGRIVSQNVPPSRVRIDGDRRYESPAPNRRGDVFRAPVRFVGETTLVPVRVDYARCLSDPSYNPWSLHGVNTRSGCFGAISDCLYSVSAEFIPSDALRRFVLTVSGGDAVAQRISTFSNIALYHTGSPWSRIFSARDVRVIGAIDDRSFSASNASSTFVAAFGSDRRACDVVANTIPCVVIGDRPPMARIFVIARDYLDPSTATAPLSRPELTVRVYAA